MIGKEENERKEFGVTDIEVLGLEREFRIQRQGNWLKALEHILSRQEAGIYPRLRGVPRQGPASERHADEV